MLWVRRPRARACGPFATQPGPEGLDPIIAGVTSVSTCPMSSDRVTLYPTTPDVYICVTLGTFALPPLEGMRCF